MVVLLAARFPPTVFQAVTRWVEDHQICRLLVFSAFFFWAAFAPHLAAAGLGLAARLGFVVSMADTTLITRPRVGVFDLARAGLPLFLAGLAFVVAARLTEAFFFGGLLGGRPHRGLVSDFRSSDLALLRGFDLT